MERTYVVDRLIKDRYKDLISKHLRETKTFQARFKKCGGSALKTLLKRQKNELYQAITEDQQVFLRKDSVLGYLDRYF